MLCSQMILSSKTPTTRYWPSGTSLNSKRSPSAMLRRCPTCFVSASLPASEIRIGIGFSAGVTPVQRVSPATEPCAAGSTAFLAVSAAMASEPLATAGASTRAPTRTSQRRASWYSVDSGLAFATTQRSWAMPSGRRSRNEYAVPRAKCSGTLLGSRSSPCRNFSIAPAWSPRAMSAAPSACSCAAGETSLVTG